MMRAAGDWVNRPYLSPEYPDAAKAWQRAIGVNRPYLSRVPDTAKAVIFVDLVISTFDESSSRQVVDVSG
jgi:hypothetical protein